MSDMLPVPFTSDERKVLIEVEHTIRVGLRTFLDVGEALATIRDQCLYREEFSTFEDYCKTKWNVTARRSRQLIDAHDVVAALPMGTIVPVNEGQARELVGLTPTQAATVMETTVETTGGKVTAEAIRSVRRKATFLPSGKPDARSTADIGNAVPPVKRKARQRPLPDAYFDYTWRVRKATESLSRLHQDERFVRNRQSVTVRSASSLAMAANELLDLLDDLGVDRHRYGHLGGGDRDE